MKLWCPNNYFSRDPHFVILAWVQIWNIFEKLMKVWSPLEFFHRNMSHDNYFSHDPQFVILAWVQSWNIFEKLMKVCIPPEILHKNMSHEWLPLSWSTFRDSSMGTKLKYFWKTHESVKSSWIFSQKHVSRTITFHVIHISWFQHGYKVEIFLKKIGRASCRERV